jgi:tRNA threonylcarbamoyladenosine biosynthesis protein TsaE
VTADGFETVAATADDARDLGRRLAGVLRRGDLVILTGELGAGKTTLVQGLGEGLQVRGSVTSPTFVIARVHPSLVDGPALVHVDAYRLGGVAELDDLDLDASLDEAVTVVEWGEGVAETLADTRLEVHLARSSGDSSDDEAPGGESSADADETRRVRVTAVGERWRGVGLAAALA